MHDGMEYDLIQGQGHEPFKVGNPAIFSSYLLRYLQWERVTDHGFFTRVQYLNSAGRIFFCTCPSFYVT